jgi:glycosyltransferase involved in cell wall biosynthesis
MPLVTVILSTYNWSAVLPFSIQSVLNQTFTDFELLVIGDGCTDDSESVVARYADPRVRWINLPRNTGGQFGPNNEGLRQAKGKLVAYLGHDDMWSRDHLENLTRFCQDREDVFAAAGIVWFDESSNVLCVCGIDKSIDVTEVKNWVHPSGWMHSLSLVSTVGPWTDYRSLLEKMTDQDFLERLATYSPCHLIGRVSVAKIPAAFRKDIYKRLDTTPQRNISRELENNPSFIRDAAIHFLARTVCKLQPRAIHAGLIYRRLKTLVGDLGLRAVRNHMFPPAVVEKNVTVAVRKFKGLE